METGDAKGSLCKEQYPSSSATEINSCIAHRLLKAEQPTPTAKHASHRRHLKGAELITGVLVPLFRYVFRTPAANRLDALKCRVHVCVTCPCRLMLQFLTILTLTADWHSLWPYGYRVSFAKLRPMTRSQRGLKKRSSLRTRATRSTRSTRSELKEPGRFGIASFSTNDFHSQ